MSNERLRKLERRWKETGSLEDESAYIAERVRIGELYLGRVVLAARIGHSAALAYAQGNVDGDFKHPFTFALENQNGLWVDQPTSMRARITAVRQLERLEDVIVTQLPHDALNVAEYWVLQQDYSTPILPPWLELDQKSYHSFQEAVQRVFELIEPALSSSTIPVFSSTRRGLLGAIDCMFSPITRPDTEIEATYLCFGNVHLALGFSDYISDQMGFGNWNDKSIAIKEMFKEALESELLPWLLGNGDPVLDRYNARQEEKE